MLQAFCRAYRSIMLYTRPTRVRCVYIIFTHSTVSFTRPKDENIDEKRARKADLKEERKVTPTSSVFWSNIYVRRYTLMQQRRADKKATTVAFRSEALKQERCLLNNSTPATVM